MNGVNEVERTNVRVESESNRCEKRQVQVLPPLSPATPSPAPTVSHHIPLAHPIPASLHSPLFALISD